MWRLPAAAARPSARSGVARRSSSAICYVTLRPEGIMAYQETFVQRDQHRIYVRDHSGNWALAHPQRVAGLVLLNTYYCEMPTLRPPEAIWLFSTPVIRSVARPVSRMFGNWLFRRMYWWQVG